MDIYAQIVISIIKHQETIIGPVAVEQAQQTPHLVVDWKKQEVSFDGDPAPIIDKLVAAYSKLFGQISVEVSKEAAASLLPQIHHGTLPHSLE